MRFNYLIILFFITLLSISCTENDNNSSTDGYDRSSLLSNVVDNIMIPAHQNFDSQLELFESAVNSFGQDRSISNLELMQDQFIEAYKACQHIEMFNIGYAEEIFYASKMNIYPANITRITQNINSDNVDLDGNSNQFSAQGFPAVDYLLFGLGETNDQILNVYVTDNNLTFGYLNLLVSKMVNNTDSVINYWKNGRDIQSTERVGKDLDILDSIPYGDKVRTEQTRQEQQQRPNPLDSMPIATNDYGECVDTLLDSMNESDTNW